MKRNKILVITVIIAVSVVLLCAGGIAAWYFWPEGAPEICAEGEHNFAEWETVQRATCGVEGKKISSCTKCGTSGEEIIPATGKHEYTQWEILKAATFTEGGEMRRNCTLCDAAEEKCEIGALSAGSTLSVSETFADLSVEEFSIVYSDAGLEALNEQAANRLATALKKATGKTLTVNTHATATKRFEILVGDTNRAESKGVLAALEGEGYAIRVLNNKLVIVGSDELQTLAAVSYFIRENLTHRDADGSIRVAEQVTLRTVGKAETIATSFGTQFNSVHDRTLKIDASHSYVASSTSDSRDHAVVVAHNFAKTLGALFGGGEHDVTFRSDEKTSDYEVLIGTADRGEVKSLLSMLDGNEYAILVREGQVILTAHNDYALDRCVEQFWAWLNANKSTDGEGTSIWSLPVGFCYIGVGSEGWVADFPRPTGEGISMHSSLYLHQDALQYLYMGEGVSKQAFDTYCETLVNAGYRVYTQSNIEGSYFTTFTNETEMLYVAYNAYTHAGEDHNRDDSTHRTKYPYLDYEVCIRVVSAPIGSAYLAPETLLSKQNYQKVTESSITTVRVQDAVGHSYVITLEDGTFIFIDGGSNSAEARNNLWNTLCAIHEENSGSPVSPSNPVRMKAWYVTHSHGDHYGAFYNLIKARVPSGELQVEYLIGNFPHKSSMNSVGSGTTWAGNAAVNLLPDYGLQYVKVFTGQKLYFANMEMEVLMTFADHAPRLIDNSNDTNTVTRLVFNAGKQGVAEKDWLFLGDSCLYQSRYLCAMYGEYLKSDMVQLAHHGNIGCEIALYKLSAPEVIWYPHSSAGYNNYAGHPGSSAWTYSVTDYVVRKLESVKYIYVSGCKGIAGTEATALAFKSDGTLDYENIYNPITGAKVTYITDSVYASPSPAIKLR